LQVQCEFAIILLAIANLDKGEQSMRRDVTGKYSVSNVSGESVQAFIPNPLPPVPPLDISGKILKKLDRATQALGELNGVVRNLTNPELFLYVYVRREAVLSSQIEGTQSSLTDLLSHEVHGQPGVPLADVKEVSSYVAAMDHGMNRIKGGFPLSLRLIREMHAILLSHGRGKGMSPGEFRHSQNWIGGTRPGNAVFVPPPPEHVMDCMGKLELFLHDEKLMITPLVRAALAHVQFETIHPFLDGNGRIGRLLIPLMLWSEGVLYEPLLYISLYFKKKRTQYYEKLGRVRIKGDWEDWIAFLADAVFETATDGATLIERISALVKDHDEMIGGLGRMVRSVRKVHKILQLRPMVTIAFVCEQTGLVPNTVSACFEKLIELGIVREITAKRRSRIYAYGPLLDLISD
jgi:Fic family protein